MFPFLPSTHPMHVLFTSFFLLLLLAVAAAEDAQWLVPTLPGFPGPLPFKLETGYIGVGENEEVEMFYYFVESQGDPVRDPIVMWHTGGPGCSTIMGFLYEVGPLVFDLEGFNGRFPSLITNPNAWTQVASIIFADSPVGSGYTYSNTQEGFISSDTTAAHQSHMFLRKWMSSHPEYLQNWVYIAGDSYGGKIAPMVAYLVAKGNEDGLEPQIILKGYMTGNGRTDEKEDSNEKVPYAHRMALVSDEQFELARNKCNGIYYQPDPNNIECISALETIKTCTNPIEEYFILEPKCNLMSPKPDDFQLRKLLEEDNPTDLISLSKNVWPCRSFDDLAAYVWANNETVQEVLHVRKGTFPYWRRCNESMSYDQDVHSVFYYHRVLNEKGFQILAYSGDHDMAVPFLSTRKWIHKLNLTLVDEWRPWFVDGQVAGYTEKYDNGHKGFVTFATVKGAGHVTPTYKPKESYAMFKRWVSLYPI